MKENSKEVQEEGQELGNIESQQELPVAGDDREMSLSLPHHQEAFQD